MGTADIVLKAFIDAQQHPQDFPGIFESTIGVAFLGTPHRGASPLLAKNLVLAAWSLNPEEPIYPEILSATQRGNEILLSTVDTFTRLCSSREISLDCFFEEDFTQLPQSDQRSGKISNVRSTLRCITISANIPFRDSLSTNPPDASTVGPVSASSGIISR